MGCSERGCGGGDVCVGDESGAALYRYLRMEVKEGNNGSSDQQENRSDEQFHPRAFLWAFMLLRHGRSE